MRFQQTVFAEIHQFELFRPGARKSAFGRQSDQLRLQNLHTALGGKRLHPFINRFERRFPAGRQVHGNLRQMPALQNDADGAHMRKAAAFFADERGDFLRQPQIIAVQIDVVRHQRFARADGRRARARMKYGFADIRRVAPNGHLFL